MMSSEKAEIERMRGALRLARAYFALLGKGAQMSPLSCNGKRVKLKDFVITEAGAALDKINEALGAGTTTP